METTVFIIDMKLAQTVLRAKIIEAAEGQRKFREEKKELLFRANELLSRGDTMRHGVLQQVGASHQERIDCRPDIRAMTLALTYARGLPYKMQEKKCAFLGKAPYHFYRRVTNMLSRTQGVEMSNDAWNTLRDDVASWMKGNPTMAVRAARDKAEAAIVSGTAFEEK